MSNLKDIINNNKPKMEYCRVFYVNIGESPSHQIPRILDSAKESLVYSFDIRNVIFVPTRTEPSGWQYPQG